MPNPVETTRDARALQAITYYYHGSEVSSDQINEYYDTSAALYQQTCGQAPGDHFVQQFTSSLAGKSFNRDVPATPYSIFSASLNNGGGCAEGSPGRARFYIANNIRGVARLVTWDESGAAQAPALFGELVMYTMLHGVDLSQWKDTINNKIMYTLRRNIPNLSLDWIDELYSYTIAVLSQFHNMDDSISNSLLLLLNKGETELARVFLTSLANVSEPVNYGDTPWHKQALGALIHIAASQELTDARRGLIQTALRILQDNEAEALRSTYHGRRGDMHLNLFLNVAFLLRYPAFSSSIEGQIDSILQRIVQPSIPEEIRGGEQYVVAMNLIRELQRFYGRLQEAGQLPSGGTDRQAVESLLGRLITAVGAGRFIGPLRLVFAGPRRRISQAEKREEKLLAEAFHLLMLGHGDEIHSIDPRRNIKYGPSGASNPPAPAGAAPVSSTPPPSGGYSGASDSPFDWVTAAAMAVPQYIATAIASGIGYLASHVEYFYEPVTAAGDYEITYAGDEGDQIYAEWDEDAMIAEDVGDYDTATDDFAITGFATGAAEFSGIPAGI